jgi:ParB-like chromosome segregation protein Spo0J
MSRRGSIQPAVEPESVQRNQSLYLAPEQLSPNEANEKARPSETSAERAARVAAMAESIRANGQQYPVLVVQVEEGNVVTYEYVDGGCRVEAIARLNDQSVGTEYSTDGLLWKPLVVWCSLVNPTEDLFRLACAGNMHRTQNSILDMALICQEARERNGWHGWGVGRKVAQYLGVSEPRVCEYEKLLKAPKAIQERIRSGEIATMDAALRLMGVEPCKQEQVVERAVEIAEEELDGNGNNISRSSAHPGISVDQLQSDTDTQRTRTDKPATKHGNDRRGQQSRNVSKTAKPAKVKSRHIARAIEETVEQTPVKGNLFSSDILRLFLERMEKYGNWDEGCFYYNERSASELQEPILLAREFFSTESK